MYHTCQGYAEYLRETQKANEAPGNIQGNLAALDYNVRYCHFPGIELVAATGPDTFCITNFSNGTTAIHVGDIRKKTLTQVMTMMATFPHKGVSAAAKSSYGTIQRPVSLIFYRSDPKSIDTSCYWKSFRSYQLAMF